MTDNGAFKRRPYDEHDACAQLLEQLGTMPQAEIRDFCAGIVYHFAERYRKERHDKYALHSIGAEGVARLYRFGSQQRRWYDVEPNVQRAVGSLYSLPPEGLDWLGLKVGDTIGLLRIYAQVCADIRQPVLQSNLTRICTTALQTGAEEGRDLLVSLVGERQYRLALEENS